MNDRERAVNQDLQILGDAYRLGQIQREEYRARRRHVLAGLRASNDADTTHKPLKAARPDEAPRAPQAAAESPQAGAASPSMFPSGTGSGSGSAAIGSPPAAAAPRVAWKYWLLFGLGLLAVAVAVALLLKSPDEEAPVAAKPVASADPLSELEATASRFTDRDDWQPTAVEAWLSVWQQADLAVRRAALTRPALQLLRDQATYHLSVRRALAPTDAGSSAAASASTGTVAIERLLKALDPASLPG